MAVFEEVADISCCICMPHTNREIFMFCSLLVFRGVAAVAGITRALFGCAGAVR